MTDQVEDMDLGKIVTDDNNHSGLVWDDSVSDLRLTFLPQLRVILLINFDCFGEFVCQELAIHYLFR